MIEHLEYATYNHSEVNTHLIICCNESGGCNIYIWYNLYVRPPYKKENKWNYLKTLH